VLLHHAKSLGQLDPVERAKEVAEEVAVARAKNEEVVAAGALGAGREGEQSAVAELHRRQLLEGDRGGLDRLAVDPDRPLAVCGRVVDSLDQVPGNGSAVRRLAYSR
jgi:hypothetical protein